jgi:hypothetical protein
MPALEQGGAVGSAGRARDQVELDRQRRQRMVWIATSGVLLVVVAVAAVLVVRNRTPSAPAPATPSAADRAAPASLKIAAGRDRVSPGADSRRRQDRGRTRIRRCAECQSRPAETGYAGAGLLAEDAAR